MFYVSRLNDLMVLFFGIFLETPQSSFSLIKATIFIAQKNKFKEVICALPNMFCLLKPDNSECMGKTFQAAITNTWELFDPTSLLQNIFLISAKLNFHQPLVCSTICRVQYYTLEVGGSSVWQISKRYFAWVIYRQKALMC